VSVLAKLLLTLAVLLTGVALTPPARQYRGPAPVVFVKPQHPRAGRRTSVLIAAMPRGAKDVALTASGVRWPIRKVGARSYRASPVPVNAGPWPLRVSFRYGGSEQTIVAAVVNVKPRR
jgi:hypothetical protein